MDGLTRRIADYAAGARFEHLPSAVVAAAELRLVDSLACAIAAYRCPAAEIGRRLARGALPERYPGRILGFGERSTAEASAFVNTAMIRALDWNDQYPGGHPSDCLGALLALAETAGGGGPRLLASMVVAYELFVRLNDATLLRDRGWDQGFVAGVCTAAACGTLLGLAPQAIGDAVAITAVGNVPLRNTRAGELSMWKGAATAYAVRNGVFGALLAAEGMTGPERPFEGRHGLWDLITGPFELPSLPNEGGPFRIEAVNLKYWPVEYNAQLTVWAGLKLREAIDWRDLASVDVGTDPFAVSEIAGDPEKWDPKTRETADHSLPYILARTLVDGTIGVGSFEEAAFADPALRPLMAKIRVHGDDRMGAAHPSAPAITIDAVAADGRRHTFELQNPLGHANNPMQEQDVRAKFLGVAEPILGSPRAAQALDRWFGLHHVADMRPALELLDIEDSGQ